MSAVQKIITIDGPAASGKSTVSREVAKTLGFNWVSTGAFYRGLGYVALESRVDLEDGEALARLAQNAALWQVKMTLPRTEVWFNGRDVTDLIQHEDVGSMASRISQVPQVRAALLQAQRDCYLSSPNGLVAEGRDCGTVIFPQAGSKIYLTADQTSRAIRRAQEQGAGVAEIEALQKQRDHQDRNRKVAPMVKADTAHLLDTTHLDLNLVVQKVLELIRQDFKKLEPEIKL